MTKTVSFVARDELAEWLESRADEQMKSISAVCQDIVAAEYRRQMKAETDKPDQKAGKSGQTQEAEVEALESVTAFDFGSRSKADAVRTEFSEHLADRDDKRMTRVHFVEGTPSEVVKKLERRSED